MAQIKKQHSGSALKLLDMPEMVRATLEFCTLSGQVCFFATCSAVRRISCSQLINRTAMAQFKREHAALAWLNMPADSWVHTLKCFAKLPQKLTYELTYRTRLAQLLFQPVTSCVKVFLPVYSGHFNMQWMLDSKGTLRLLRCIPVGFDATPELRKKSRHNMVALYHNTPRDVDMLITHLNGIPLSDFACLLAVTTYMQRQTSCAIGVYFKSHRVPIPDQCFLPLEKKKRFAHEFAEI